MFFAPRLRAILPSAITLRALRRGLKKARWAGRVMMLSSIAAGAGFYFPGCNAQSMTLFWQDTSENEDGFRIYRITEIEKKIIAEVGPNVTRYVDRNAPRKACYVVTAFNAAGESVPTGSACRQD
ncbi:MAG TPA: hypothetical protein VGB09_00190 [Candidatus Binatia bacterium]